MAHCGQRKEKIMEELDSARIYFKKLKLAEELCNGDTVTAKRILQGEFQDVQIIKGRFKDAESTRYGLFLVILNKQTAGITGNYSIIAEYASVYQTKPLTPWKAFLDAIEREKGEIEYDEEISSQFNNALKRFLEIKKIEQVINWVETNAIVELTDTFTEICNDVFQVDDIKVVIDFEAATSVDVFESLGVRPVFE